MPSMATSTRSSWGLVTSSLVPVAPAGAPASRCSVATAVGGAYCTGRPSTAVASTATRPWLASNATPTGPAGASTDSATRRLTPGASAMPRAPTATISPSGPSRVRSTAASVGSLLTSTSSTLAGSATSSIPAVAGVPHGAKPDWGWSTSTPAEMRLSARSSAGPSRGSATGAARSRSAPSRVPTVTGPEPPTRAVPATAQVRLVLRGSSITSAAGLRSGLISARPTATATTSTNAPSDIAALRIIPAPFARRWRHRGWGRPGWPAGRRRPVARRSASCAAGAAPRRRRPPRRAGT